jgi:SAM-dependent methyltransferase
MSTHSPEDLQRIYQTRFNKTADYRRAVWRVLIDSYFHRFVRPGDTVLDLGCGYGEFINQINCKTRLAMDLNPEAPRRVDSNVRCLLQDCSTQWELADNSLDLIFTSNFFEHLPDKSALGRTLDEAHRCLKPAGRIIALGPNVRYLSGAYWDFWDHYLPLTEESLREALETRRFNVEKCISKFLPYKMARSFRYPLLFIRLYVNVSLAWRIFGKQFLVIASK